MTALAQETTATADSREASWAELFTGRNAPISAVLIGGMILFATNTFIVSTMLPSIVADIGGRSLYAWNTTLFELAAILSAVMTGRILQRLGSRTSFAIASLIFMTGSGLAALAPSMPVLLAGRTIQGAGGGMFFTLCYSMIVLVYAQNLWPRAMALLSSTWGIATLIGPAIGGIFAQLDLWRVGFGLLIPITLIFVVLAVNLLPKQHSREGEHQPIPMFQLLLLAGSVLAISAGSMSHVLQLNFLGIAVSVILVLVLMGQEKRGKNRLFPRGSLVPGSAMFMVFASMALLIFGMESDLFMPYFLQNLHGLTPMMAGYVTTLVAVGWTLSEVLSAKLTGKQMHRAVNAGPALMFIGLVILAIATPMVTHSGMVLMATMGVGLLLIGCGIGIGWPHLSTFALQRAPEDEREYAASTLSTVQMFSIAFGAALAGMIANIAGFNNAAGTAGLERAAFWLFAIFAAFAVLAQYCVRKVVACEKQNTAGSGACGETAIPCPDVPVDQIRATQSC